jgi:hypothetical protein
VAPRASTPSLEAVKSNTINQSKTTERRKRVSDWSESEVNILVRVLLENFEDLSRKGWV